jgi:hypothetical protein
MCLLVVVAGGATGCQQNLLGSNQPRPGKSHGSPVTDAASFVNRLRAVGLDVEPGGEVEQPFFSITGTMIKVHGEDVQIFQYPNTAAADAQAAPISPDGSAVGTAKPFWVGLPHFYKNGTLLVLYVGDNDTVLQALEAVLGPQFAGRV